MSKDGIWAYLRRAWPLIALGLVGASLVFIVVLDDGSPPARSSWTVATEYRGEVEPGQSNNYTLTLVRPGNQSTGDVEVEIPRASVRVRPIEPGPRFRMQMETLHGQTAMDRVFDPKNLTSDPKMKNVGPTSLALPSDTYEVTISTPEEETVPYAVEVRVGVSSHATARDLVTDGEALRNVGLGSVGAALAPLIIGGISRLRRGRLL